MKIRDLGDRGANIVARGSILVFFVMAFEVMIMISPFAFFFYSVFNPIFHWLDAYSATRWLTHFFLPHMVLPPTLPLKIIRVVGSVLFVLGCATFIVCALQIYLGKLFKPGIAHRGVYRYVRHPQYTSLAIWGIGMAILWPRFIVLATLSIMLILYYFLARDEERRMVARYGDSYREYRFATGMFLPSLGIHQPPPHRSTRPFSLRRIFALASVVLVVLGAGFVCRAVTLSALPLRSRDNVTLVSIMPEDGIKETAILRAVSRGDIGFLSKSGDYLGYEMPPDYIMQGMIADTGSTHHLYKQHHTVGLIVDWVLHPFEHLRRSPSARMARAMNVDPAVARRHHCPLGISDQPDCEHCTYRRVIFVQVTSPSSKRLSGKGLFALDTTRIPIGFIDIDTTTGKILHAERVPPTTAWSGVPTPEI